MFNPWLELSLKAVHMGMEAQSVIALRMLRLATGGARTEADASRMVTNMVTNDVAAAEAQAVAAVSALNGRSPHVVVSQAPRVVKKRVRSNKRRRSRHSAPLSHLLTGSGTELNGLLNSTPVFLLAPLQC
jgi:hypothetical protein